MTGKLFRIAFVALFTCLVTTLSAQTITGNVKDSTGEPILGATIMETGTKNGTVTDMDGNFTIKLQSAGNLSVSYIGMQTQIVKTAGKTTVNVTLQDDNTTLNEVVVVGYGTMKKSDLTGSVSSINTADLNKKGAASVMEGLQGSVPGVNITKTSGRAGGDFNIEIRGKSSHNDDTKPIYVVDGVICDDIQFLNPQDIERIDVQKDASSTAIYGSRATAGVIIVTTKSGANVGLKASKPSISYDGYYGVSKIARMPDFMDGQDFYNFRFMKFLSPIAATTANGNPSYYMGNYDQMALVANGADGTSYSVLKQILQNGSSTDWADMVTRNGSQQNHYLAVSGGGQDIHYHMGFGYNQEKGIYEGDQKDQITIKASLDAKINKILTAGFTANMAYIMNEYANDKGVELAYRLNPFCQPYSTTPDARNGYIYDANGNIPGDGYNGYYYNSDGQIMKNYRPGDKYSMGTESTGNQFSDQFNPLYLMDAYERERQTWRLLGNFYLQLQPIKELTVKTVFQPSFSYYRDGTFSDIVLDDKGALLDKTFGTVNTAGEPMNYALRKTKRSISWTWDNIVTYNKTFSKIHNVNVMGLFSMSKGTTEEDQIRSVGVLEGSLWHNMNSGTVDPTETKTAYGDNALMSYALRANYTLLERYMLTATMRWDGSSKLADGHRWSSFPSVAVAWRMSEESFLKNVDWLSNLKLRVSYGETGNNAGIGNYGYMPGFGDPVYYPFGGVYQTGRYPNGIVDKSLSWERSHEWNFGLDFGFLNGRISGSIDYYEKNSEDLLYKVKLPLEAGGVEMETNVGKVRNRGVEIAVTATPIRNKDWNWDITASFSHNVNKLRDINGQGTDLPADQLFIGKSINNVYAYDWIGIVSDRYMTVPDTKIAQAMMPDQIGQSVREYEYYNKCYGLYEGQPIIDDVNGDGIFDDSDKKVWSADPDWIGSLSTSVSYKNWDFSASLYTRQGGKMSSDFYGSYLDYKDRGWMHLNVDYYIPAGTLLDCDGINPDGTYINPVYQQQTQYGDYPFPNDGENAGIGKSSSYAFNRDGVQCQKVTDASFVKVKHMSLGYTFPKKWISKVGISHLRLYCTVTNPFVWSDYKGFDPEWGGNGLKNDGPSTVTWEFGASLKF
ncbi:MAG: TonB-dependent receptor [Bacteroidales bacterium]|nr:TonB-dependent receptor [Bacteroidales bacterium]MCM1207234.1 TonB-dependent receptor [Bacillota bacterium]